MARNRTTTSTRDERPPFIFSEEAPPKPGQVAWASGSNQGRSSPAAGTAKELKEGRGGEGAEIALRFSEQEGRQQVHIGSRVELPYAVLSDWLGEEPESVGAQQVAEK